MEKLFLFIAILISTAAFAQPFKVTSQTFSNPNYYPSPYTQVGQMLDITNSYSYLNVTPFVRNSFKDTTTTGTATKYLYTSIAGTAVNAVDTFVPMGLYGDGFITFYVSGIKVSGTPAGNITIEQSPDGFIWTPVHTSNARTIASSLTGTVTTTNLLNTPDTFIIANVAAIQAYSWDYGIKYGPYFRANISTTGTETWSCRVWYCFTRRFFFTN